MDIYGHILLELTISACVLICREDYGDLLCYNWAKYAKHVNFVPTGDFYYYLWSYMIEIDMSAYGLTCLEVYGDHQGNKLVKI